MSLARLDLSSPGKRRAEVDADDRSGRRSTKRQNRSSGPDDLMELEYTGRRFRSRPQSRNTSGKASSADSKSGDENADVPQTSNTMHNDPQVENVQTSSAHIEASTTEGQALTITQTTAAVVQNAASQTAAAQSPKVQGGSLPKTTVQENPTFVQSSIEIHNAPANEQTRDQHISNVNPANVIPVQTKQESFEAMSQPAADDLTRSRAPVSNDGAVDIPAEDPKKAYATPINLQNEGATLSDTRTVDGPEPDDREIEIMRAASRAKGSTHNKKWATKALKHNGNKILIRVRELTSGGLNDGEIAERIASKITIPSATTTTTAQSESITPAPLSSSALQAAEFERNITIVMTALKLPREDAVTTLRAENNSLMKRITTFRSAPYTLDDEQIVTMLINSLSDRRRAQLLARYG